MPFGVKLNINQCEKVIEAQRLSGQVLQFSRFFMDIPLGDAQTTTIPAGNDDFTIDCDGPAEDNQNEQSETEGHNFTKDRLNSSAQTQTKRQMHLRSRSDRPANSQL
jgi:hypothetical protein